MERLLNEAISTVDAAEREKKQSRNKQQEPILRQFQQRQERMSGETPLANDGSLDDRPEEQALMRR
jgi:hypothetical protein